MVYTLQVPASKIGKLELIQSLWKHEPNKGLE